ncbi:MAG: hypothetical protein EG826_15570 [Deltaproteobacteria bacterium]|nr:hypothetical protein [Deltaproteobacteria bacterium]
MAVWNPYEELRNKYQAMDACPHESIRRAHARAIDRLVSRAVRLGFNAEVLRSIQNRRGQ